MAVTCQTCGVSMTTAERTRNQTNAAGNWHVDCERLENLRDVGAAADPAWRAEIVRSLQKLTHKKAGVVDQWP